MGCIEVRENAIILLLNESGNLRLADNLYLYDNIGKRYGVVQASCKLYVHCTVIYVYIIIIIIQLHISIFAMLLCAKCYNGFNKNAVPASREPAARLRVVKARFKLGLIVQRKFLRKLQFFYLFSKGKTARTARNVAFVALFCHRSFGPEIIGSGAPIFPSEYCTNILSKIY